MILAGPGYLHHNLDNFLPAPRYYLVHLDGYIQSKITTVEDTISSLKITFILTITL